MTLVTFITPYYAYSFPVAFTLSCIEVVSLLICLIIAASEMDRHIISMLLRGYDFWFLYIAYYLLFWTTPGYLGSSEASTSAAFRDVVVLMHILTLCGMGVIVMIDSLPILKRREKISVLGLVLLVNMYNQISYGFNSRLRIPVTMVRCASLTWLDAQIVYPSSRLVFEAPAYSFFLDVITSTI
jgi:hypothetical protein